MLLSKDDAGTVLSFVVAEGSWDDTQRVDAFETMARKMAPVVGGLPLTLRLVTLDANGQKGAAANVTRNGNTVTLKLDAQGQVEFAKK